MQVRARTSVTIEAAVAAAAGTGNAHSAMLTDSGVDGVERKVNAASLYNPENVQLLHHLTQALRARTLYKRDVNYLIEEGEAIIVDEFTGRKMPGRRWSDGLHQAVEAKEGVEIQAAMVRAPVAETVRSAAPLATWMVEATGANKDSTAHRCRPMAAATDSVFPAASLSAPAAPAPTCIVTAV